MKPTRRLFMFMCFISIYVYELINANKKNMNYCFYVCHLFSLFIL